MTSARAEYAFDPRVFEGRPGGSLRLSATIKNISKAPIDVSTYADVVIHAKSILLDGRPLKADVYEISFDNDPASVARARMRKLPPGATFTFPIERVWDLDLSPGKSPTVRQYPAPLPGVYEIRFEYFFPEIYLDVFHGPVAAPPVTIKLVAP